MTTALGRRSTARPDAARPSPARIAGIDPGIGGAIAVLHGNALVELHDMPLITDRTGRQRVNPVALAELLRHAEPHLVLLEQVNAMPSTGPRRRTMGAQSMFNFGRGFGVVEATAQVLGLPLRFVAPATWKARAGLTRRPKDYARTVALQLYPQANLHRKADGGRADAILIARFGHDHW